MKIEMCEQMVQSWLQHIKGCQVVQTNWMISPLMDISSHLSYVDWFMKDISGKLNAKIDEETLAAMAMIDEVDVSTEITDYHNVDSNNDVSELAPFAAYQNMLDFFATLNKKEKAAMENIFGKSTAHQFVTQCEIDVVGIKLYDNETSQSPYGVERIYLADSAFHKGSLGYGDAAARVLKKIIRAIPVSEIVFGNQIPIEIAFATPNCGKGLHAKIKDLVSILEDILKKHYAPRYDNIEIKLYFNKDFAQQIYIPLKDHIDELNNDNDLFMRALNLAKIAEEKLSPPKKFKTGKTAGTATPPTSTRSVTGGFSDAQRYAAAAYYLRNDDATLGKVQVSALGIPANQGNGTPVKNILNSLGIDTGRNSPHKGLLNRSSIDDAIAKASGTFKTTLEDIKKRGLHL